MRVAQNAQAERDRGQMSLFGNGEEAPTATVTLTDAPKYEPLERLMREREQLGFYVSGHPLEEYSDIIENYTSASTQTLVAHRIDSEVDVAGMITEVKNITTKKGASMAVIGLEDLEGAIEVVIFPEAYKTAGDLVEGRVVWIRGKVNVNQNSRNRRSENGGAEREVRQIQADRVIDIESVRDQQTSALEVTIPESDIENVEKLQRLQEIARANKGDLDLILRLMSPRYGEVIARCAEKYSVTNEPQLIEQVEGLFGENCVKSSNRTIRGNKSRTSQMDFV